MVKITRARQRNKKKISLTLDRNLIPFLKSKGKEFGKSASDVVNEALRIYFLNDKTYCLYEMRRSKGEFLFWKFRFEQAAQESSFVANENVMIEQLHP